MLKQVDYIVTTPEEEFLIESVKEGVDNIRATGNFFVLPLKTLELMRRFNKLYIEVYENGAKSGSEINQLVVLANSLEKELIQVL